MSRTDKKRTAIPPGTPVAAEYIYCGENGLPLYLKRRYEWQESGARQKAFLYFTFVGHNRDGSPKYVSGLSKNLPRVPYRYPELRETIQNDPTQTIYVVDGEKDCETLERFGHRATTAPNGNMGNWRPEHAGYFYGARHVVIIADNDPSGQGYREAWRIADDLKGYRRGVHVVQIVEVLRTPDGKDVTEWLAAL